LPIDLLENHKNREKIIKKSLRQFILLLIIGQIFLVGAIIQSDKIHYSDVPPTIEEHEMQYDMDLPEGLGDEMVSDSSEEEVCKDCDLDEVNINRLIFRDESPFEVLDLELGRKVKIFK
jgi:hypothetical protein